MGNILVLRGADFSEAKIGTRTVPEATTSSGLYFRYIDSFTVTQSLTGCTSTNSTEHVQDGGTFETTLNATAGYNDITQDMITVVDTNNNPVSFTFSGKTLRIENITTDIRITVTSTEKQVTLESIAVSGYATSPVNIDTGSDKAYYSSTNNLKNKIAVTATFSDGATQPVAAADYTLTLTSGGNLTTEGTKEFTVSYTYNNVTKTETFNVEYVYQYYDITKRINGNNITIVETIDGQTSSASQIRHGHAYTATITGPNGTTVTVNGGTPYIIVDNNPIEISENNVTADITIIITEAEQLNDLNTPLYITAGEANSKLRLEFNVVNPQYEYASCVSNSIIEKLQYSTDLSTWSDFSIDSENTSYSNAINLTNVGDTVYIRAAQELNRTGIQLINVKTTINESYFVNEDNSSTYDYYQYKYNENGIYDSSYSGSATTAYYPYGLEAGWDNKNDTRFVKINVIKSDNTNAEFSAGGNIMSLLYGGDNFKGKKEFPGVDELLNNNTSETEIINTISHSIYFKNAGGFTGLFADTKITQLPKIHAKYIPFSGFARFALRCTSLTDLSNITLSLKCCSDFALAYMFSGCTNVIALPSITNDNTSGGYNAGYGAMYSMFGSVNSAAETKITDWSALTLPSSIWYFTCVTMFNGCSNMETAPSIVADKLKADSCSWMFKNCANLQNITITSTVDCYAIKPSTATKPSSQRLKLYGLGNPAKTDTHGGWLYCDATRTKTGTIHIKQALINTIPEGTSALTDTSIANAKKYHHSGLPYYTDESDNNKVKPWTVTTIS